MSSLQQGLDVSRYGNSVPTQLKGVIDLNPSDIPTMIEDLRRTFATDRTRSKAWRLGQLQAFLRMIEEEGEALCEAMLQDLHKSPLEGYLTELGLVKAEIETAIECLDEWMTPIKTANSALNIPCWSTTQRDPLGVVLIMGAWNYPMQLSLAPLVGAIAGGNCVVIKPGSYAVASSHALARAISKHLDPNCIRAIEGNRDITSALLKESFETIFFTGSAFVGRMVAEAAARNLRPCVLELGGKSPTIIDKSANLTHAVQRLIWGTFVNGGQTCVRPDFCCVHADVADQFFDLCRKYIKQFYGEDPQKTEWFGRCINDGAWKRLNGLLDQSRDRVVCGGRSDSSDRFIEPTVLDFGTNMSEFQNSPIMQDEIFGPLLPCVRFTNLESVIDLIRNLPTGKPLALYCFASNSQVINEIKHRTTSGGLVINDCLMHLANHELPFGGVGNSGMGSYHGVRSFNAFTHEKAVLEKSQWIDESFLMKPLLTARFPPYTPLKASLVKLFSLHWVGKAVNYPIPLIRLGFKLLVGYLIFSSLGFRLTHEETPYSGAITNFFRQYLWK